MSFLTRAINRAWGAIVGTGAPSSAATITLKTASTTPLPTQSSTELPPTASSAVEHAVSDEDDPQYTDNEDQDDIEASDGLEQSDVEEDSDGEDYDDYDEHDIPAEFDTPAHPDEAQDDDSTEENDAVEEDFIEGEDDQDSEGNGAAHGEEEEAESELVSDTDAADHMSNAAEETASLGKRKRARNDEGDLGLLHRPSPRRYRKIAHLPAHGRHRFAFPEIESHLRRRRRKINQKGPKDQRPTKRVKYEHPAKDLEQMQSAFLEEWKTIYGPKYPVGMRRYLPHRPPRRAEREDSDTAQSEVAVRARTAQKITEATRAIVSTIHVPEASSVPLGDLDNPIHEVFGLDRWEGISEEFYTRMEPALRLASLWITEEKMLDWFVHTALGEELRKDDGSRFLRRNANVTKEDALEFVRKVFKILAQITRFEFFDPAEYPEQTRTGRTDFSDGKPEEKVMLVECAERLGRNFDQHPLGFAKIELGYLFKAFLGEDVAAKSPAEQLNFHFQFAVTLVHELAHAFSAVARGWNWIGSKDNADPYHTEDSDIAELGFSWEHHLAGAIIEGFDGKDDPKTPLLRTFSAHSFKMTAYPEFERNGNFNLVSPDWIRLWFLKETWYNIRKSGHQFLKDDVQRVRLVSERSVLFPMLTHASIVANGVPQQVITIMDGVD